MAEFTPSKKTAQDFNNGVEYINEDVGITGDALQAETINNLVESALYTQDQADNAVNNASGAVDTANNALTVANGLDEQIKTANVTADMANSTSQEAKGIAEEAKQIAEDAQKGVGTKVTVGGEVVATFDADTKVNKAGDTMTGPLTLSAESNNFISRNDEFNFAGNLGSELLYLNLHNAATPIRNYAFCKGTGSLEYAGIIAAGGVMTEQLILSDGANVSGGTLISPSNNFIRHGNQFNFIPDDYNSDIWINFGAASNVGDITAYRFGNGQHNSGYAPLYASQFYVDGEAVYSPKNKPVQGEILYNTDNLTTGLKSIPKDISLFTFISFFAKMSTNDWIAVTCPGFYLYWIAGGVNSKLIIKTGNEYVSLYYNASAKGFVINSLNGISGLYVLGMI